MSERAFIEKLNKENSAFPYERSARNMANALTSLSSDIFTEYIRFLFELVQNADDAEATQLTINVGAGHITIAHNGKPFTEGDVEAICSIGEGTKRGDQSKTGYKGIGFKSVFGKSRDVAIFSDGFQFRFSQAFRHEQYPDTPMPWHIIPEWVEKSAYPAPVFELPGAHPWTVITVLSMAGADQLRTDLLELIGNGEVLLFLRHLLKIQVVGLEEMTIARTIKLGTASYTAVALEKNGTVISEWLTHTFDRIAIAPEVRKELSLDEKMPRKLQEAEHADIAFAAKLHNGKITRLLDEESLIYTYLPTKVRNFRFPFLVNSSFLTNAGREELHDDRRWNAWLMEQVGEKIVDWLALLAGTDDHRDHILLLLPTDSQLGGRLAVEFYRAYKRQATAMAFIPARSGGLLKAGETLVDGTGLSEVAFIPPEAVIEFYNAIHGCALGPKAFIRSEVVEPRELKRLHAHFLEHDDLGDFFTHEAFRKHHGPVQNHLLIRYFFERSAGSTDAGIRARLQRLPFIYGEGDMLRPPMEICFPSKAEATDLEKEVTVIHAAVYREIEAFPDILRWLEELGVSVVSELSWLENEVLPRLNSLNYKEHFLDLTMSICKLHKRGQLSASHIMDLSEFRLKCTNGSIRPARECYLSDVYLPELPLEDTVDRSIAGHGVHFVSREYLDELALDKGDLKSFFTAIQVKEDIKITCHSTPVHWPLAGSDEYRSYIHATYDNGTSNWPYHTGGAKSDSHAFVGHCDFAMLKHCVRSHRLAKLLFKHLITANGDEDTLRAIEKPSVLLHGFERDKRLAVPNYVKWSFQSSRCFPATDGEVYKAEDVYLNSPENVEIGGSLLPVFDHEERITNDWLKLFRFKEKIGLTDLLLVLGHLAQGADSGGKIRKQDIKRIGLVYTKLASEVPSFSSAQKSELNSWAQKNKVLTSDGDFALPSELKWVKEAGRKVPKGRIRTLVVPEECPTDAGFEQLLHDLGVEIIDTFNVNALDEREDTVLMERLKPLVPFLALVASIRQSEDLKEVLERIETRRKKLRLFQCTDLSLVFRAEGVEMPGELMQCHRDGNTIRYRGSWTSKSTLYELVPELARALDVPKLNMDLMRLLQSDLDEIGAFMEELGADVSALPNDVREAALMGLLTDVEDEENIPTSSKNHLAQNRKHEANREARDKVLKRLKERGYDITKADATHSVVNGVFKDGKEYPLVIKSYRNTSFKFNIRPNEWAQLDRENAMFWVHRGEGSLVVLQLADLLAANKEFHVQFETETFGRDGMAEFARAFRQRDGRFVRNVYFQLDAPDFRMEDALGEYRFNVRTEEKLEKGDDNEKLLH